MCKKSLYHRRIFSAAKIYFRWSSTFCSSLINQTYKLKAVAKQYSFVLSAYTYLCKRYQPYYHAVLRKERKKESIREWNVWKWNRDESLHYSSFYLQALSFKTKIVMKQIKIYNIARNKQFSVIQFILLQIVNTSIENYELW